ncbi:MAG TPA: tripartite tricarboxylate transporter substrate binding protein [Burkholderiales bacterium]
MNWRTTLITAFAVACASPALAAQTAYPNKTIRMIVGYPPGGGADIMARLVGERASEALGVSLVIDNRPGAGSTLAMGLAAQATPDGYTLLFSTAGLTINPSLYNRVPYDPINDFAPISQVTSSPFVLVVREAMPVKNLKELIAAAKAKPGSLIYSSGGNGSTGHLSGELFKSMAGIDVQHIPYKGLAPALNDLLGGRVDMTMSSLPSCMGHIKAKRLKALAITTARRMPFAADIPTMAEGGLEGYDIEQWYGVLAPSGTGKDAVYKVYEALKRTLRSDDAQLAEKLASMGSRMNVTDPGEFARFIPANLAMWAGIVKISGARVE